MDNDMKPFDRAVCAAFRFLSFFSVVATMVVILLSLWFFDNPLIVYKAILTSVTIIVTSLVVQTIFTEKAGKDKADKT